MCVFEHEHVILDYWYKIQIGLIQIDFNGCIHTMQQQTRNLGCTQE